MNDVWCSKALNFRPRPPYNKNSGSILMSYMTYVTLPDPNGPKPALFLLYSSDPDGQIYNQDSKSWGVAWVPWCWAWEKPLWCHMWLGPPPPMKADGSIICPSSPASLHPNIHLSIQMVTASKSSQTLYKTSQRGKSRSYVCQKKMYWARGRVCGQMRTDTQTQAFVCVWMCVKLLDGQVREMWCKFTQSPLSFAFKARGLAECTTAGGTVKEPSSKRLSLPRLTYIWPWQANPNTEKRTYAKTICRRRKAGYGGRASLHLVTDTAAWRETSANMLIHKACRRMARPALLCSLLCQCGCYVCVRAFMCMHP